MRHSHVRGFALCALLGLCLTAAQAQANDIYATACAGPADTRMLFSTDETVCVAGDVDFTCPVRPFVALPAADVYVVPTGSDPLSGVPIHFETLGGFGSGTLTFSNPPMFSGPLPGSCSGSC